MTVAMTWLTNRAAFGSKHPSARSSGKTTNRPFQNIFSCVAIALVSIANFNAILRAADLTLHYHQPAPDTAAGWEQRALPIGNGRIGAMLFGGVARERVQFNDISLWTGDDTVMGAYQPFGDVFIELPGKDTNVTDYVRELDLEQGVHRVRYKVGGVTFRREYFASHPAQVIVVRLEADKRGSYTGSIQLMDMHGAKIVAADNRITATGSLAGFAQPSRRPTAARPPSSKNKMAYEAQAFVKNEGGELTVDGERVRFVGCNALTII